MATTTIEIDAALEAALAEIAELEAQPLGSVAERMLLLGVRDVRDRLAPTMATLEAALRDVGARRILAAVEELPDDPDPDDEESDPCPDTPTPAPTPSPTAPQGPTSAPDASGSPSKDETSSSTGGSPTSPEPSRPTTSSSSESPERSPGESSGQRSQPTPNGEPTTEATTTEPSTSSPTPSSTPTRASETSTSPDPDQQDNDSRSSSNEPEPPSSEQPDGSSTPDHDTDDTLDEAEWSARALDLIQQLHDAGCTFKDIAAAVSRSDQSIHNWRSAGRVPYDPDVSQALDRLAAHKLDASEPVEQPEDPDSDIVENDIPDDVTLRECGANSCRAGTESTWCDTHGDMVTRIARDRRSTSGSGAVREAMSLVAEFGDDALVEAGVA